MNLGDLELLVAEFTGGALLTSPCGTRGTLILLMDKVSQMSLVRMTLGCVTREVTALFEECGVFTDPAVIGGEQQLIASILEELADY